jgi:tetratricopeptide (TPR) repeat protein
MKKLSLIYIFSILITNLYGQTDNVQKGLMYFEKGAFEMALEAFDDAITDEPAVAQYYYYRGNTHFALEDYKKAISDFTAVLEIDPKYTDALFNRGNAYYELENYQKAIKDFDRLIAMKPELSEAYQVRGSAYFNVEKYENAIEDYNQAIQHTEDNHADLYYDLGNAYFMMSNFSGIIGLFLKSNKSRQHQPKLLFQPGIVLFLPRYFI